MGSFKVIPLKVSGLKSGGKNLDPCSVDDGVSDGVRWGVTLMGVSASDSSPPAMGRELTL